MESQGFKIRVRNAGLRTGAMVLMAAGLSTLAGSEVFAEGDDVHAHHVHDSAGSFFDNLFKVYTPRRVCMNYEAPVIWLHFASDLVISLAYYSIPIALVYFFHRRTHIDSHW